MLKNLSHDKIRLFASLCDIELYDESFEAAGGGIILQGEVQLGEEKSDGITYLKPGKHEIAEGSN